MGAATRLHVEAGDVDDAQQVAGHDTTLVEREAETALGLAFGEKVGAHRCGNQHATVGFFFDLRHLLDRKTGEVCDVQVRLFGRLFGAVLPHVSTQHGAGRTEQHVRASMVFAEQFSPRLVDA